MTHIVALGHGFINVVSVSDVIHARGSLFSVHVDATMVANHRSLFLRRQNIVVARHVLFSISEPAFVIKCRLGRDYRLLGLFKGRLTSS